MSPPTWSFANASWWTRFWHQPLRAERPALVRIFFALALLAEQFIQYLPDFADLFGPDSVGFSGLHDEYLLRTWRWTILLTGTDMLSTSLFLLMLTPSGKALSVDAWRLRRQATPLPADGPSPARPTVPAWGVRLLQLQLCIIYLTTGLAKLRGADERMLDGAWWNGTALHYVLNSLTLARVSSAQLPVPLWVTASASYVSVWFEVLFPLLVLWRRTRKWALWFGVLFHLGIYLAIEIGWFCFYTVCLYGAWVPGEFWDQRGRKR
ncbi:MAG: HTTM domain-containing protein [Planctomycetes bacterium]|nr:HTTM domain-containing protein [Planctomycetota bacterium]